MNLEVGDVVQHRQTPHLVGRVDRVKMNDYFVRLDTGGLTAWSHHETQPVEVRYLERHVNDELIFCGRIDETRPRRAWLLRHGHWERAPRGMATEMLHSGDWVDSVPPADKT